MTEEEFRARFDRDRREGNLTWVANEITFGIALGLNDPDTIVLHGGHEMPMATARFIEEP